MTTWNLEYLLNDVWIHLYAKPSGDAAKTAARNHQIGRGREEKYRILAPDGSVWLYGRPTHGAKGLRMDWRRYAF